MSEYTTDAFVVVYIHFSDTLIKVIYRLDLESFLSDINVNL